jgi:kynurenine formamidase
MMSLDHDFEILKSACEKYRNWGKWGEDDQIGTLNYITREMVVEATKLVGRGRVFSLAISFDGSGPQTGGIRRFNPMTFMLRDGRDTVGGPILGSPQGYGAADDVVMMPTHGATHWDALSHIFWDGKMWNGYDAGMVTSIGAERNGIEHYRDKIVARGVLLDIPRLKGVEHLELGYPITTEDLEEAAKRANVAVGRGDILLIRTGHIGYCRAKGEWGGYAGGDAAGLSFDTAGWLYRREIAGVAADTWGVEVRPNQLKGINQPWHRVTIPNMGLLVGELFDLEELARDCAKDGVYEFLFAAPPLPLTGSVGSPVNPMAIK